MKKIVSLIVSALALCSCGTTYLAETYGDITLMDCNGQTIREWNGSVIESRVIVENYSSTSTTEKTYGIKEGGALNFKDKDGVYHYVSGGIIIVDNLKEKKHNVYAEREANRVAELEAVKKLYATITTQIEENKKEFARLKKSDDMTDIQKIPQLIEQTTDLNRQLEELRKRGLTLGGAYTDFPTIYLRWNGYASPNR